LLLACLLVSCQSDESGRKSKDVSLPKFDNLAVVSISISPYIERVEKSGVSKPFPLYDKESALPKLSDVDSRLPRVASSEGNMLYLAHYVTDLLELLDLKLPGNVVTPELVLSDSVVRQLPARQWIVHEIDLFPYKMFQISDVVYSGMLRRSLKVDALSRAHFRFFVLPLKEPNMYRVGVELLWEIWPQEGETVLFHWLELSSPKQIEGVFPRAMTFEDGGIGDGAQEALDAISQEISSVDKL
jgi:hypothetical protein